VKRLGLIVGSGELPWQLDWTQAGSADTEFGAASMAPEVAALANIELVRIRRHGEPHRFAPHAINYRANLSALANMSVDAIIALNTVGGITPEATTGALLLPDQLIDYTWGRRQSFCADDAVRHIDFSNPYDCGLQMSLKSAADNCGIAVVEGGVMAVTQGPRLETAAEVRRLARDGCAVVGMTGMPEAALARELDIPFAAICLVVNPAAGVAGAETVDMQSLQEVARAGMHTVSELLLAFVERGV
jgi:5'-methylthioinosine phosphorylase